MLASRLCGALPRARAAAAPPLSPTGGLDRRVHTTTGCSYKGRVFEDDVGVRAWLSQYPGGSVKLELDEDMATAHLHLCNAKKLNALTGTMMVELADAVAKLEDWDNGRFVILKGDNGTFCAGGDLDFMLSIGDSTSGGRMSAFMHGVMTQLRSLPLISLAVVDGNALGGGAELAVACDFTLMHTKAKIAFKQCELGVSPGWGGTVPLITSVGRRCAIDLLASGRLLRSDEALRVSLVDAVYDDHSEVAAFLRRFTGGELTAVRGAKSLVAELCAVDESSRKRAIERRTFATLWGGPGHMRRLDGLMKRLGKEPVQ